MERISLTQPPRQVVRRADDKIKRERRIEGVVDAARLIDLVAGRHDDEDVHVAVGVRRAISIGAEEDDLVGLESLGDLAGEAADDVHRNVRPAKPGRRWSVALTGHSVILASRTADDFTRVMLRPRVTYTKRIHHTRPRHGGQGS